VVLDSACAYAWGVIVDAVVVAGGRSERFGEDKLLAELCGKAVLTWSLRAMHEAALVGRVIVVVPDPADTAYRARVAGGLEGSDLDWVAAGSRRRDSVEAGLRRASSRYVAIHDGARPLVTAALVDRVVAAAEGRPGAVAAIPVTDTIKVVQDGAIVEHPDRRRLWAAQTPQVVLRQAWLDAAAAGDGDETDDAAMLARLGLECVVVEGAADNIKVTRPQDLALAQALLAERG
jgi:2-C-methyl-D-erythritol 4-phosphate cytidylyltransferase